MKKLLILFGFGLVSSLAHGQLLEENFDSGIPGDWTQWSGDGINWTAGDDLGIGESGCALADFSASSEMGSAWLQTPLMDLSDYEDVQITFSAGVVLNNFMHPSVSLWYDIGGGWVFLSDWGSEWGDFDNTIDVSADYEPPLNYDLVSWNSGLVFDLSAFDGVSSIRFSFGSDFTNGGYVVVDDVGITGTYTGDDLGVGEKESLTEVNVYPNPANDILNVEIGDTGIDEISVYSMLGNLVETVQVNNEALLQLDLSHLEKGMYTIVFSEKEEKKQSQLITIY